MHEHADFECSPPVCSNSWDSFTDLNASRDAVALPTRANRPRQMMAVFIFMMPAVSTSHHMLGDELLIALGPPHVPLILPELEDSWTAETNDDRCEALEKRI